MSLESYRIKKDAEDFLIKMSKNAFAPNEHHLRNCLIEAYFKGREDLYEELLLQSEALKNVSKQPNKPKEYY